MICSIIERNYRYWRMLRIEFRLRDYKNCLLRVRRRCSKLLTMPIVLGPPMPLMPMTHPPGPTLSVS